MRHIQHGPTGTWKSPWEHRNPLSLPSLPLAPQLSSAGEGTTTPQSHQSHQGHVLSDPGQGQPPKPKRSHPGQQSGHGKD